MAILRDMLDAGPSTTDKLRTMFPDDASFQQFSTVLRAERNADKIRSAFSRLGGNLARLAGLGAGFGATSSLFDALSGG